MIRRESRRGYLIAVLACAISVVTLGYLALANFATKTEDKTEEALAVTRAYYAAESGIIQAESLLKTRGPDSPKPGLWFGGEFSVEETDFELEVSSEGHERKKFSIVSSGTSKGEGDSVHTVKFGAKYVFQAGSGWTAIWRGKI